MKQDNKETHLVIIVKIFEDLEKNNNIKCDEKECLFQKYGCRGPKTKHCFTSIKIN